MHMENHQLTAQAIRRQDTLSHHSSRTSQYTVSPLIHVSTISPTTPEEQSYVDVVIEQEITQNILLLATKMQTLSQNAGTNIKQDREQKHFLEHFHKELEACHEGLHTTILQPLFAELINMYYDFGRLIDDTAAKEANATRECIIKNMQSFQETLEDILQRYGVKTFRVEQKTFLASKQRVLQVIQTSDPTLDRHIAGRIHKGFQYKGKILSPEVVTVYKTVLK